MMTTTSMVDMVMEALAVVALAGTTSVSLAGIITVALAAVALAGMTTVALAAVALAEVSLAGITTVALAAVALAGMTMDIITDAQRQSAVCPGPSPLTSSVRSFTRHFPRCRHFLPVQNLRDSRLTYVASQFDQPLAQDSRRDASALWWLEHLSPAAWSAAHFFRSGVLRIKPFVFQDDLAENTHPGPAQQVSSSQEEMGTMCSPQTTAVWGSLQPPDLCPRSSQEPSDLVGRAAT